MSSQNSTMSQSSATERTVLSAKDIHKSFGDVHVLRGIDLDVHLGEVVCLLGPSGGGKSTLLRTFNALETIDRGSIRIGNDLLGFSDTDGERRRVPEKVLAKQRQQIGMVFQQFNLFPHLSALENVACGPIHALGTPKAEAHEEARRLLGMVGLSRHEQAYPLQLSGGQQQRVAIARALAMKPTLMLFDEPTSALDPEMVKEVLDVLFELRNEGMTMILVTHEVGFARAAADRVVLLADGVIAEAAPPDQFFSNPQSERTRQFLSNILH
jgi:polar amino acid transport system ATP-binding protein